MKDFVFSGLPDVSKIFAKPSLQDRTDLTDEQKEILTDVVRALKERCWSESSYVTIRIQGRDELLSEFVCSCHPDFSIEGREVVLQKPFCSFCHSPLEVDPYDGTKFCPKLKNEKLKAPLVSYIEKYGFDDIISISYRRKVYYQRQNG